MEYYHSANDSTTLNDVFSKILENIIAPSITLGSNSVIKDNLSNYFKLPSGFITSDVKVYSQKYIGNNSWESKVPVNNITIDASTTNNNISAFGYDFDANYVTQTAKPDGSYGKKLVIEYNVTRADGFIGGNAVPTGTNESGAYLNNALVANFNQANTDVAIDYNFGAQSQKVYLTNEANIKALLLDDAKFVPNGINNAFVDIVYTLKQGTNTVANYRIAAGADQGVWTFETGFIENPALLRTAKYDIECKVIPNAAGTVAEKPFLKDATVYVYAPVLTLANSTANYSDTLNLNSNVSSDWKCTEITDNSVPLGSAPTLEYAFKDKDTGDDIANPSAYKITKDSNFTVGNVKANGQGILAYTQFNTKDFSISLNRFDLIINKTIEGGAKVDQNFVMAVSNQIGQVFNVTFSAKDFGNSRTVTKKIKGLYCGMDYTVAEKKDWSWRYTPDKESLIVNEPTKNVTNTVTFINTRTNDKWLSGDLHSYLNNN